MVDLAEIRKKNKKSAEGEKPAAPPKKQTRASTRKKKQQEAVPRETPAESKQTLQEQKEELLTEQEPLPEPPPIDSPSQQQWEADSDVFLSEREEFCLVFMLRKERCAIPIEDIIEIISVLPITPVPNVPPEILGIISLRGTVVTIMDLGVILGHKHTEVTEDSRIIVLRNEDEYQGFLVDQVIRAIPINMDELEPPPVTGDRAGFIRGLAQYEKKILMILSGEALT